MPTFAYRARDARGTPAAGDYTGHDQVGGFFQRTMELSGGAFSMDVHKDSITIEVLPRDESVDEIQACYEARGAACVLSGCPLPLTVGHSTSDELRDIDHAFNAEKINASRDVRRLVIVDVISCRQLDGIYATRQKGRVIRPVVVRDVVGSDSDGRDCTIDQRASRTEGRAELVRAVSSNRARRARNRLHCADLCAKSL
jgi:hypothetical protein